MRPYGGVDLALCVRGSHRRWGLKESPPPYHLVNILAARRYQAFTWIKEIREKLLSADPSYLFIDIFMYDDFVIYDFCVSNIKRAKQ